MNTLALNTAAPARPLFKWSIGIHTGDSPFTLSEPADVTNPIITSHDIGDMPARFVADPFMVLRDGIWHLFFEAMDDHLRRGAIALATSRDARAWRYEGIVLAEPYHLSYPYLFEWEGRHYMIPESLEPRAVRLYRARRFPHEWEYVADLLEEQCADSSIIRRDGRWWLFTCTRPYQHDILRLYHAEDLAGPWREHPASPIVDGDAARARPAGKIIEWEGKLVRFSQDCTGCYGRQVRAFEIDHLDAERYSEHERHDSPVLAPSGRGWNGKCMHHIDAHRLDDGSWIACVDGYVLDEE
jgi:hypothetical protein